MQKILAIGLGALLALAPLKTMADPFGIPEQVTNATFVIYENPGGNVHQFQNAVMDYQKRNIRLIINGTCASACTTAFEMMFLQGGKACIGSKAVFKYHMIKSVSYSPSDFASKYPNVSYWIPALLRAKVISWVRDNGGWREHDLPLVEVGFDTLKDWYPVCKRY